MSGRPLPEAQARHRPYTRLVLRNDVTLGRAGRTSRLFVSAVWILLLVLGTIVGQDDDFPFGPFRMYATSNNATGVVTVLTLEVRTANGPWTRVTPAPTTVGMNVAEFEGQQPRFEENPDLLAAVASSYLRLHPGAEPWNAMRLIRRATLIVDRVPTGEETEEVLAQWEAS